MKRILGLDLGTASIGWAVINANDDLDPLSIEKAGSRIIPMTADEISDFNNGTLQSNASTRTRFRSIRRMIERSHNRRYRLLRCLRLIGFLPKHYDDCIDRYGKFIGDSEPKIAWKPNEVTKKFEFLFQSSFNEMIDEFKQRHPELDSNKKIPYDWTIYYLRKKALSQPILKEELAWILLQFNKKRGYYQQRLLDDLPNENKLEEYVEAIVIRCEEDNESKKNKKGESWFNIYLDNGMTIRRSYKEMPKLVGELLKLIVTKTIKDGEFEKDKDGNIKQSFRSVKDEDWAVLKKFSEDRINQSKKTVGEFIFDNILDNPDQRVVGGIIRTIERDYYLSELTKILEVQSQFHKEFSNAELYRSCLEELYPTNKTHQEEISKKDLKFLLVNDILMYQRPLKSQKKLIRKCPFETFTSKDGSILSCRCVSKSNPFFQEFRIWQFISSLQIYQRKEEIDGNIHLDVNKTSQFLKTDSDYVKLFKTLYDKRSISQNVLLKYFKLDKENYRWNFVEDKEYPCNETRNAIINAIKHCKLNKTVYLVPTYEEDQIIQTDNRIQLKESEIWYYLYSISDKKKLRKTFSKYVERNNLPIELAEALTNIKPYAKTYASYSLKAIKKLLTLMRRGELWHAEAIDNATTTRINKIIDGEADETISERIREKVSGRNDISQFSGLPLWTACYVVYNRHSEAADTTKWDSPNDIRAWIQNFRHNSLRNPVVEKVILETMQLVADIWDRFGKIDEIHLELGREMKNNNENRKFITNQNLNNEKENRRIYNMLCEFYEHLNITDLNPNSPSQQEKFKIVENAAFLSFEDSIDTKPNFKESQEYIEYKECEAIRKKFADKNKRPTKTEVTKYYLWLEQRYLSPYTGNPIQLSKLFSADYQIEHIIPKSVFFNDSFSNKVVCEAVVNSDKGRSLAFPYIKANAGRTFSMPSGNTVTILSVDNYKKHVATIYKHNQKKLKNLLLEDISDSFIDRQLKDTQYISKYIKHLLSNIVRENNEQESMSKNIIVCNGTITSILKHDWGINDKWNEIILPRFLRLNQITSSSNFTYINKTGHLVPCVPNFAFSFMEKSKTNQFNPQDATSRLKRIDHRHHAMDAIVIACATRSHINLLNNEYAKSDNRHLRDALSRKLRVLEPKQDRNGKHILVPTTFSLPWKLFPIDVYKALCDIIVTYKYKTKIIKNNKNKNCKNIVDGVNLNQNITVRKTLHAMTYYGLVDICKKDSVALKDALNPIYTIIDTELRQVIQKMTAEGHNLKTITKFFDNNKDKYPQYNKKAIEVMYFTNDTNDVGQMQVASRYNLVSLFNDIKNPPNNSEKKSDNNEFNKKLDSNFKTVKDILEKIADKDVRNIVLNHYLEYQNNPEFAFSDEGIRKMNENIIRLNNGKNHKPIYSIRKLEPLGAKFKVGNKKCKKAQYVIAEKDTNLFFGVYLDKDGNRVLSTISLRDSINALKAGKNPVPAVLNNNTLLFSLSPNDLVYLPTDEEIQSGKINQKIDINRIYKVVSFTSDRIYFVQQFVAYPIVSKLEFEKKNKIERAVTGEIIKRYCIPIKTNRLGEIIQIGNV